ncbi:hypothetical protein G5I_13686 [Acromyrmex echinatior]|uniref:Uncharacterized protein n=1 Tax=Acromyrmex echinatior TaxID=103372 RepID=F4X5P7_ACREC|nr:hypothetical protein G5I_13686 [Acromyrmex echinatior]
MDRAAKRANEDSVLEHEHEYGPTDRTPFIVHMQVSSDCITESAFEVLMKRQVAKVVHSDIVSMKKVSRGKISVEMRTYEAANNLVTTQTSSRQENADISRSSPKSLLKVLLLAPNILSPYVREQMSPDNNPLSHLRREITINSYRISPISKSFPLSLEEARREYLISPNGRSPNISRDGVLLNHDRANHPRNNYHYEHDALPAGHIDVAMFSGGAENSVSLLSSQAAPPPGYLFQLLGSPWSELLLLRGKGQLL